MTTLAAMIHRVDLEVGRLVNELKALGELENTLIWFVSDNGACPYDRRNERIDAIPTDGSVSWSDSTGWAWVRNSPFRYYKQNQFEGGISTPAIVHWPAGLKTRPGAVTRTPAHLIDVLPTIAELAHCDIPRQWEGRTLRPVSGQSLRPIFEGESFTRLEPIHFLFNQDRALRDGDWKAVSYRGEAWELYNLAEDRSEQNDLSKSEPTRLQSMIDRWTNMAKEVLHAPARAIAPAGPAKLPHTHPEWTDFSSDPANAGIKRQRKQKSVGSE